MAKVYITEFGDVASLPGGTAQVGGGVIREQTPITSSAASQQSAPFNGGSRMLRIHSDGIVSIALGPAATAVATVNSMRLAANQTEYFAPRAGDVVAVITNT